MNALWLERISTYRTLELSLQSAKALLAVKDSRRVHILKRNHVAHSYLSYENAQTYTSILLIEARNAKVFWALYARLLPLWCNNFKRRPRSKDLVNQLLDVGYHHLATLVEKIILEKDVSASLGLIHKAHRANSKPLVYDLMELFRADLVDAVLLRYLRLKKKPVTSASEHIGHFLAEINKVVQAKHYLKDFKHCHTYRYYMELQIVKFIRAVNRKELYEPLKLPRRHDSRCACRKEIEILDQSTKA